MMKNKKPEIRFKGFSEDWTERELDTVFHKIRNAFVGVATPYYVSEGHFYLESNNVKDGQINRNNEIFINEEFYQKQKDNWLHTGDIAMVQSGHVGHSAVIPPELNNTAAHALIIFAEPKEKINSHFLNYQFQTTQTKKELRDITTGNTIKHILSSEMKRFNVVMSEYEEQTQIGNFFKNLDNLITLHQRKYEKLGILKKAMLEKMFPKNGADVPEIRFKGFEGAWEERTLSCVVSRVSCISNKVGLPRVEYEDIVSGKGELNKNIEQKNSSKIGIEFEIGDVLYGKLRPYLNNWLLPTFQGIAVGDFWVFRPNETNSKFIFYLIQTSDYEKIANQSSGSKMPRADWNLMSNAVFFIPLNKKEQEKIGNYFKNLDKLLTLNQGELGKLKNLKKAMLEKMFV